MTMSINIIKYHNQSFKSEKDMEGIRNALAKEHYQQISIKTPEEIEKLKVSGGICASILDDISPHVKPGTTIKKLNDLIQDLIYNKYDAEIDKLVIDGEKSSANRIFACFGLNNIIGNAEPNDTPLQIGDIFGIDISVKKDGWCGDTRKSWIIGDEASPITWNLFTTSHIAMWLAISMVRDGVKVETIANAVEEYANKQGLSMIKLPVTVGHSIGRSKMDGWLIPLYNNPINKGRILKKGMVIAIEAFMSAGSGEAALLDNDLGTAVTKDDAIACYWEHTVVVTENGCEILDLRSGEKTNWANIFMEKTP